jgi:DNA-directed RNA polymerase specialized sigma24 family protein
MDIDEAAVVLSGPRSPGWNDALEVLGRFVETEATKTRASRAEAEDIAQNVAFKLWQRLDTGEVPWAPGAHRAYLKQCARNAVVDLRRASAGRVEALKPDELADGGQDAGANEVTELAAAVWDLLEKVAARARQCRAARYHADFDRTWKELCALVRGASLRELLGSSEIVPSESEERFTQARNAAYKAHERMRTALLAAVGDLKNTGKFTEAEALRASQALRVFVRCQRRTEKHVTEGKGRR